MPGSSQNKTIVVTILLIIVMMITTIIIMIIITTNLWACYNYSNSTVAPCALFAENQLTIDLTP